MSSYYFHKKMGHQELAPIHREISNAAVATTITLYTPTGRLAVTNLSVTSDAANGTISLYWTQSANQNQHHLATFANSGSATIFPCVTNWESTAIAAPLGCRVSTGVTNGWHVNVEGFEIYDQ